MTLESLWNECENGCSTGVSKAVCSQTVESVDDCVVCSRNEGTENENPRRTAALLNPNRKILWEEKDNRQSLVGEDHKKQEKVYICTGKKDGQCRFIKGKSLCTETQRG